MGIENEATGGIPLERIAEIRETLLGDRHRRTMMDAVKTNGLGDVALNHDALIDTQDTFSIEIPTGSVTDQERSGRCWMFAGLNLLREGIAKDLGLEALELSEIYLTFFEKLEKANAHLESILTTLDEPRDGRLLHWLLGHPAADGGQWDLFVNLVEKYGVVPNWIMPETKNARETAVMNRLLATKLRRDTLVLRTAHAAGASTEALAEEKDAMMVEIYRILTIFLGDPPLEFDLEYRGADKSFHAERHLAPQAFYRRHTPIDLTEYVSVTHVPSKPYGRLYTVLHLDKVVGGRPNLNLNVDATTFRSLALTQLEAGEPVWLGCDVVPMMEPSSGVLHGELYDEEGVFGVSFTLPKRDRLDDGGVIWGGHNMLFTGVHVVDGVPVRWKVENSWGAECGRKGYFVMSDSWFEAYTYQLAIRRRHLPPALLEVLEEPAVALAPWDIMHGL